MDATLFDRLLARTFNRGPVSPFVQVLDATRKSLTLTDPGSETLPTADGLLAVDERTMSAGFVVSTARRDHAGDIVVPAGCLETLRDYEQNPVVFYAHQSTCPPVAKACDPSGKLALWFEQSRILSRAYFHGKTRESDEVFKLVAAGVLKAASIGFVPLEADLIPPGDIEGQLAEGRLEFDFGGYVFKRWHLLEWSVVPVPANPGALRSCLERGEVRSRVLLKSLWPMAEKTPVSLWLSPVVKGLAAEPTNPPAEPAEIDAAGRDQGKEKPQAVFFSPRRFADAEACSVWLTDNGLQAAALTAPTDECCDHVASLFEASCCAADTVRRQEVEDGVTVVYCQVKETPETVPQLTPDKLATRLVVKEPPRDHIRWNKSLSEAFDVAAQPLPPATLTYDWVCRHVGCAIKQLAHSSLTVPSARMGTFLTGLRQLLSPHEHVDTRNISGGSECPPVYERIRLTSQKTDDFLVEGTSFYRGAQGAFAVRLSPCWYGLDVEVFARKDQGDLGRKLLDDALVWAKEHNFLKGEAFSLSGEFIDRTAEGWDDVFLEEENKQSLRRTVDQLNTKKGAFPNRGVILTGPPGTGKTLSGRIVRNTAEATFIWLSARDFYRSGSFGGLSFGFEMARELAPSVLFVEDVDNWLDGYSIDLLKTEMDGIARSTGVLTVLTTNFPEQLPEALIDRPGRFHDVLCFAHPDAKVRSEMLSTWVKGASPECLRQAVDRTDGYSGAHLRELANFALALVESEGVPIDAAMALAIDKVEKQKELISGVQLHGSRYRPRKELEAFLTKSLPMSVQTVDLGEVKEMPENPGRPESAPTPEKKRRPYGADVLEGACKKASDCHAFLKEADEILDQTRVKKYASRAMAKLDRLVNDAIRLGASLYPDHFESDGVEYSDDEEVSPEKMAEAATLLAEMAQSQALPASQKIACGALAQALAGKPLAPAIAAPAVKSEQPPATEVRAEAVTPEAPVFDPETQAEIQARLQALADALYAATGVEV